jgi:hypothetical protein
MTLGWIITRTYGSGFTDFISLNEDSMGWSNSGRNATIFRDRAMAENVLGLLKEDPRVELVPVEAYC